MLELDESAAKKILEVVDAGLCSGLGRPEPGHMCVEAAVAYALGLPFNDTPECVDKTLSGVKVALNDCLDYVSYEDRAKVLRRIAVAQIGSAGVLDIGDLILKVAQLTVKHAWVPTVPARWADKLVLTLGNSPLPLISDAVKADTFISPRNRNGMLNLAEHIGSGLCGWVGSFVKGAAYTWRYHLNDRKVDLRGEFIEDLVQYLVEKKVPGTQFLYLTEQTCTLDMVAHLRGPRARDAAFRGRP